MKKIIFALLLIPLFASPQTFERIIDLDATVYTRNLLETEYGYLISANFAENGHSEQTPHLIMLDKKGEIIKIVKYDCYYKQSIIELWRINDSTYGAISYCAESAESVLKIIYQQLNGNLKITFSNEYVTKNHWDKIKEIKSDIHINSDKSIIFQLTINSNTEGGYYFLKYNSNGALVKSNHVLAHAAWGSGITTNHNSGYLFFDYNLGFELDSNLMVVDEFTPNNLKDLMISEPIWENDSILTFSSPYNFTTVNYEMGLCRTKWGKDVIEEKRFAAIEPMEIPGQWKSIDTSGNSFYMAAKTHFGGFGEGYYLINNKIRIIKVNKDFSIKWDKTYCENTGFNRIIYLTATRDGGCIVMGARYNSEVPDRMLDLIYLLKVDSLGNYNTTDIVETELPQNNISLYPNPGNGTINLKIPAGNSKTAVFNLYTTTGKKVLTKQVNAIQTTITTGYLSTGMYVYELCQNGMIINRGKWVKQ